MALRDRQTGRQGSLGRKQFSSREFAADPIGIAFYSMRVILSLIALERRPVVLSDREEQLYRLAFSSIDKRGFQRLVSLARSVDCSPGQVILEKCQDISEAIVVIAGKLEAILGGNSRMALRPGQLIGDVSAYSGLVSPADVVARGPGFSQSGPAARERVHSEQTRTPSQPSADCEHGSCRPNCATSPSRVPV
jgi:hypothetical protein